MTERPRFIPIVEKPVRTEIEIRKQRNKAKREALHAALRAHVEKEAQL
jgi:hypothetical protein